MRYISDKKMAMVPPEHAVETAVRYFFYNWMCGLQPTLSIQTLNDGNFSINVGVTTCLPVIKDNVTSTPRRKRSGKAARKRRKEHRAYKSENSSNGSSSDVIMSEPTEVAVNVGNNILNTDMVTHSTVSHEVITEDLIDLTDSSTNAIFREETLDYSSGYSSGVSSDYKLGSSEFSSIAIPSNQPGTSDQTQVELMLYSMVKELYSRTFKTEFLGYGHGQDPTVCSRPAVGRP